MTLGAFEISMDVETETGDGNPFDVYLSEDVVESRYYEGEVRRLVAAAIDQLSPKERHVVLRRFEFTEGARNTLDVISKELGLTKERVRQIELQAKRRLKTWFTEGAHNMRVLDGVPC